MCADFFVFKEGEIMENRLALIGIIIEDFEASQTVNSVLHDFASFIIGRMGIPYRERNVSVISVAIDAPNDTISSLSGKLGMIKGVSTKTIYSKLNKKKESYD